MENKKPRKPGSGGKREGAGRKTDIPTVMISLRLPVGLAEYLDLLGGSRTAQIAQIIRTHKARTEQLVQEADEASERFKDAPL